MAATPLFTVFTPTFNRAHTIRRVFDSLRAQTIGDFEWLVVDDGSTDGTADLLAAWAKDAAFPVRCVRQDHSGKHIAHNRAVAEARGVFFLPLDSDDAYLPDSLERMLHCWNSIPAVDRDKFCGVAGLSIDQHGKLVGDRFPRDPLDADMRERHYIYHVRGEKGVMMRTAVVRRYLFPEIAGTNFAPEGIVWLDMGKSYKIRWVNEIFRVYYVNDGATGSTLTDRNLVQSAPGRLYYYIWLLNNDFEFFFRSPAPFIKAAVMLPISAWLSGQAVRRVLPSLEILSARLLVLLALPVSVLLYMSVRVGGAVPVSSTDSAKSKG
jgi:glycosyltransferase involved in cell wall biosynthesis